MCNNNDDSDRKLSLHVKRQCLDVVPVFYGFRVFEYYLIYLLYLIIYISRCTWFALCVLLLAADPSARRTIQRWPLRQRRHLADRPGNYSAVTSSRIPV